VHATLSETQIIRQIAQLSVLLQSAAHELSDFAVFFGAENVSHIRTGAADLVRASGGLLTAHTETGAGLSRDLRHDLRNHVAVVKGFADLILMDLPRNHSARGMLENLSRQSLDFVALLDQHRDAGAGDGCQHAP